MCGINRSVTPETFQIVHKHSHLFFYSSHIQSLLNLIISLLFLGRRRRERFVRRFLLLYTSCHLLASHTHTQRTRMHAAKRRVCVVLSTCAEGPSPQPISHGHIQYFTNFPWDSSGGWCQDECWTCSAEHQRYRREQNKKIISNFPWCL